jgi:hypothetical protein
MLLVKDLKMRLIQKDKNGNKFVCIFVPGSLKSPSERVVSMFLKGEETLMPLNNIEKDIQDFKISARVCEFSKITEDSITNFIRENDICEVFCFWHEDRYLCYYKTREDLGGALVDNFMPDCISKHDFKIGDLVYSKHFGIVGYVGKVEKNTIQVSGYGFADFNKYPTSRMQRYFDKKEDYSRFLFYKLKSTVKIGAFSVDKDGICKKFEGGRVLEVFKIGG